MKRMSVKIFKDVCFAMMVGCLSCANAALDNTGCSNDDNAYVSPELALCSTHVYNIGGIENPKSDSERQIMRDVVALKTTVMTQQMYKQYEYLESMIKRFKTQLEKAVLTTKLQASGATDEYSSYSSSGTASFKSSDRNIFMAGVSNCNNELTNQKVFECLNANLNSIYNASNNGQNITIELRKQLANDYGVALTSTGKSKTGETCTDAQNLSKKKAFQDCLDGLRGMIRTGYEAAANAQQRQNMQNRNMNTGFGAF